MMTHCVSKIVDQVIDTLKMCSSDKSIQCDDFLRRVAVILAVYTMSRSRQIRSTPSEIVANLES